MRGIMNKWSLKIGFAGRSSGGRTNRLSARAKLALLAVALFDAGAQSGHVACQTCLQRLLWGANKSDARQLHVGAENTNCDGPNTGGSPARELDLICTS